MTNSIFDICDDFAKKFIIKNNCLIVEINSNILDNIVSVDVDNKTPYIKKFLFLPFSIYGYPCYKLYYSPNNKLYSFDGWSNYFKDKREIQKQQNNIMLRDNLINGEFKYHFAIPTKSDKEKIKLKLLL